MGTSASALGTTEDVTHCMSTVPKEHGKCQTTYSLAATRRMLSFSERSGKAYLLISRGNPSPRFQSKSRIWKMESPLVVMAGRSQLAWSNTLKGFPASVTGSTPSRGQSQYQVILSHALG